MGDPAFVMLNLHRLKVQRWSRDAGEIAFTTVIRGEHLSNEIVAAIDAGPVEVVLDSGERIVGPARVTDRRASGAVQRLGIALTCVAEVVPALTVDEKLDAILAEVRALRAEVAALRGGGNRSVAPTGASTMLDFEIPTEGE